MVDSWTNVSEKAFAFYRLAAVADKHTRIREDKHYLLFIIIFCATVPMSFSLKFIVDVEEVKWDSSESLPRKQGQSNDRLPIWSLKKEVEE